jgi:hypothetical protein
MSKKFIFVGTLLALLGASVFVAGCDNGSGGGGGGDYSPSVGEQSSEAKLGTIGGTGPGTPQSGTGTLNDPYVYGEVTAFSYAGVLDGNTGGNVGVSPKAAVTLYLDAFQTPAGGNVITLGSSAVTVYIKVTSEDGTNTTYHKIDVRKSANTAEDARALANLLGNSWATASDDIVTITAPGVIKTAITVPQGVTLQVKAEFEILGTSLTAEGNITMVDGGRIVTTNGGKVVVANDDAFATVLGETGITTIEIAGDVSTYDRNSYIVRAATLSVLAGASLDVITNGDFTVDAGTTVELASGQAGGGPTLSVGRNTGILRNVAVFGNVTGGVPAGKLQVSKGRFKVDGTLKLDPGSSATVKSAATLRVANAGNLTSLSTQASASTLVVEGALEVAQGGTASIAGAVSVPDSGRTSIAGTLAVVSGGTVELKGSGELKVEAAGSAVIEGGLTVADTAKVEVAAVDGNKGELKVESGGKVEITGGELKVDGKVDIAGELTTAEGTKVEVTGAVTVETSGSAEVAGELATSEGATIDATGDFAVTGEITGEGDSVISGDGADLSGVSGGESWFTDTGKVFKLKSVNGSTATLSVLTDSVWGEDTRYVAQGNNLALLKAVYDPNAPATTDDVSLDAQAVPSSAKSAVAYTEALSAQVLSLFTFTTGASGNIDKIELSGTPPTAATYGASATNLIVIDIGKPGVDNDGLKVYIPLATDGIGALGVSGGTYSHVRLRVNRGAELVILADNSGYIASGAGHSAPNGRFNGGCVEVMAGGKLRDGAFEGFPLGANAVILNRYGSYLAVGPEPESEDATGDAATVYNLYFKGYLLGAWTGGSTDNDPKIQWDSGNAAADYLEVRPGVIATTAKLTLKRSIGLIYSVWFVDDAALTIDAASETTAPNWGGLHGLMANEKESRSQDFNFYGNGNTSITVNNGNTLDKRFLNETASDSPNALTASGSATVIQGNATGSLTNYVDGGTGISGYLITTTP